MSVKKYRYLLEQKKGERDHLRQLLIKKERKEKELSRDIVNIDLSQAIIQKVAQETQQQLEYRISGIVSLALSAIFDDPYEFKLDFVIKRGKTEAEISFVRDGEKMHPLTASGGGAVDVASFALRIALWSLKIPKTRNTIVLDEPFRFLSRELQPKASEMLKILSEKLNIQFIIVTHNEDLVKAADVVFEVKMNKYVSEVF